MTKKEFLEGMRDLVEDFKDPNGDFNGLLSELEGEEAAEIAQHDPELLVHFSNIAGSIRGLAAYVTSRFS